MAGNRSTFIAAWVLFMAAGAFVWVVNLPHGPPVQQQDTNLNEQRRDTPLKDSSSSTPRPHEKNVLIDKHKAIAVDHRIEPKLDAKVQLPVPQEQLEPSYKPFEITIEFEEKQHIVIVSPIVTDSALKQAVSAAVNLVPGSYGFQDPEGRSIAISAALLKAHVVYKIIQFPKNHLFQRAIQPDLAKELPAKLPTVVFAAIGTGRYRGMATNAAMSGVKYFGGDCIPKFFVLTDNITGIEPPLHAQYVPYREWPFSGLKKFEDMLSLKKELEEADYFYFMDADTQFEDYTELGDIAGDLVGVEHPMYPREWKGFCEIKKEFCRYPYDRNPRSHAFVPPKIDKQGPNFDWANWHYIQSAFWGGKTKFMKPFLTLLAKNVDIDLEAGIRSSVVQDERYVNWLFYTHSQDPAVNIRILKFSFLYPGERGAKGFGDWLHKTSRPIIRHRTDKQLGHLPLGEVEVESIGNKTKCLDPYIPGGGLGIWGCHHLGDTQGWKWSKKDTRFMSQSLKNKCIEGTRVPHHTPLRVGPCKNIPGQRWNFDKDTQQLINEETGLCIDTSRSDLKQGRPIGVKNCDPNSIFQKWKIIEHNGDKAE